MFIINFLAEIIAVIIIVLALVIIFICRAVINGKAKRRAAASERERKARAKKIDDEIKRDTAARAERQALDAAAVENKILRAVSLCPGSEKYRLQEQEFDVKASVLNITQFTPISKKRFVAFDFETTGLDAYSDQIIEIGAVRVVGGYVVDTFQRLVDPGRPIPRAASDVNGITDQMVAGKPAIYEALPAFLYFIGDDVIAAHNVSFDWKFLANACRQYRFRCPSQCFDTMALARYWPDAENKKLGTLAAAAGIRIDNAHRALADARAAAELIVKTNEKRKC